MSYKTEKGSQLENTIDSLVNPCDETVLLETLTDTPPNHALASARIFVEGLSVLMFNADKKRAELGFLRKEHSPLRIKIYKNGSCDVFWSWEDTARDTGNSLVTINAGKTGIGSVYQDLTIPDGEFSRMPLEDFRHMRNLAHWHNETKLKVLASAKQEISARVNILNAVFYTYKKSTRKVFRHRRPRPLQIPHDLERIGKVLGADISNSPGDTIEIQIKLPNGSSVPNIPPLVNNGTDKYVITLRTSSQTGGDHFPLLYKVLKNPHADEFFLKFESDEPHWDYCGDTGHRHPESDERPEPDERPKGSKGRMRLNSTEFVCQVFGGGCGELPD